MNAILWILHTGAPWRDLPAGFCPAGVEPWLPLGPDTDKVNVEAQRRDPGSMLSLARRLISLRRTTPALNSGSYESASGVPEDCFAFSLRTPEDEAFVALNFDAKVAEVPLPGGPERSSWRMLFSTREEIQEEQELRRSVRLGAHEGCVLVPYPR